MAKIIKYLNPNIRKKPIFENGLQFSEQISRSDQLIRTTNFTKHEFEFHQFKELPSVFIYLIVNSYIIIFVYFDLNYKPLPRKKPFKK